MSSPVASPAEAPVHHIADFEPLGITEIRTRFDFTPSPHDYFALDWWRYCQGELGLYEYPTSEYVTALTSYLGKRVTELAERADEPVTILEVAAGDGVLSALLERSLIVANIPARVIASDDNSWHRVRRFDCPVECLDYREAMYVYNPSIVIGAWVPSDFTPGFRAWPSVQEYLLIGRTLPPNIPASLAAWGLRLNERGEYVVCAEPDYEREGFQRRNLDHLRPLQINYEATSQNMHSSETVSFRRAS